ncbi:MAG: alpha/beta hydrolase [Phycisphaerae bacterium]|nr:alpha/beta hydrolase [Saprospiraceae bacterium]
MTQKVKHSTSQLQVHYPFFIPQLNRQRAIRVLLPRNYWKDTSKRFPVLYLQDGQNLFDPSTAAFRHWKLKEFMARQPLKRQAILVGIDHGGIDRGHEYAPYQRGKSGGQGDAYLQFVEHTLKPFIDLEYRTWAHREATGIVGASLGGLIAFYAGMRYSHVFGKVGALSPSFWFNPQVLGLAGKSAGLKSQIFVSGSKTETRSMMPMLEKTYWALKNGGYSDAQIRVVARDRGSHSEAFWAREFKPMYEWLFPVTAF